MSVTSESICAKYLLANSLVKLAHVRLTDHLDMTIAVDSEVKPQTKHTHKTLEI